MIKQNLQPGTTLQNGKYRIVRVLGQGGFGITYLAENTMLEGNVAIKEFFFKEYCNRDEETSHVTVPTDGNREIVERFKTKFVKEARTIFQLNHPNIVRILDVFEENGTAYYVMEYIDGESLADMVKRRRVINESEAVGYIKEAGSALAYMHGKSMNHLDIKPGNLMKRRDNNKIQLIDFGVAKQYDVVTSEGTTTTPVGISHGYSPSEQYQKYGVQSFSPQSDVYALAATLFKLLTGNTPPEAMIVQDEGLPIEELRAEGVSGPVISAIAAAMQTRTRRTQSVAEFLRNLDADDEESTEFTPDMQKDEEKRLVERKAKEGAERKLNDKGTTKRHGSHRIWISAIVIVVAVAGVIIAFKSNSDGNTEKAGPTPDSLQQENVCETFTANGVSFEMIKVKGGTFTMGSTEEDDDAIPLHNVTLSDYYIGKTEVTQALWIAVMGNSVSQIASENGVKTHGVGGNYPMYYISWNECMTFISTLNSITGKHFRMPTEAEWEFAAKGGTKSKGYKYSGSNTLDDVAWYWKNSGINYLSGTDDDWERDKVRNNKCETHQVATKAPNELGIYDMSGNVWEWCSDWYGDYSSSAQSNPTGPTSGSYRVSRGGGWNSYARGCCSLYRGNGSPNNGSDGVGLRLCLSE